MDSDPDQVERDELNAPISPVLSLSSSLLAELYAEEHEHDRLPPYDYDIQWTSYDPEEAMSDAPQSPAPDWIDEAPFPDYGYDSLYYELEGVNQDLQFYDPKVHQNPLKRVHPGTDGDDSPPPSSPRLSSEQASSTSYSALYLRRLKIPERGSSGHNIKIAWARASECVNDTIELRILHLMPAQSEHDDIICRLEVETFTPGNASSASFEALSYTWGDASHTRHIWINDRRRSVGSNLWTALKYLRLKDGARRLWVDAVCINQADHPEREYMVSQMHVIYGMARRTVAWIGLATTESERAVSFLRERLDETDSERCDMLDVDVIRSRTEEGHTLPPSWLETWDALGDLFGRPWYARAWILQEVICARDWILKCGHSELDGRALLGVDGIFHRICDAARRTPSIPLGITAILEESGGPSWKVRPGMQDMGVLLCVNRHRRAKEPKDKIYAFTNMLTKKTPELYPSYGAMDTTYKTYKAAALRVYRQSGHLQLLAECELHSEALFDRLTAVDGISRAWFLYLPSWSPNWANPRFTNGLWGGYSAPSPLPFAATGNSEFWSTLKKKYELYDLSESSDDALQVQGVVLDKVARCGRDFYGDFPSAIEFLDDMGLTLRGKPFNMLRGDDERSAVLRIVTLDRNSTGDKPYADMHACSEMEESFKRAVHGRRFFVTSRGFIGLAPTFAQENDVVALVAGCHVPIILRERVLLNPGAVCKSCRLGQQVGTICRGRCNVPGLRYDVVGEAYVHGAMNGEFAWLLDEELVGMYLDGGDGYFVDQDERARRPWPAVSTTPGFWVRFKNLHARPATRQVSGKMWVELMSRAGALSGGLTKET